jgi:hypothetical protein
MRNRLRDGLQRLRTNEARKYKIIAAKRAMMFYKAKGYDDERVSNRIKGIVVRNELTDEWKKRDVEEEVEYAVLTNIINKGTFGEGIKERL